MKFAKYWAWCWQEVDPVFFGFARLRIWGASNESQEAAQLAANQRRDKQAGFFIAEPHDASQYEYWTGYVREQVLQQIEHNGELVAVVTRNHYGAEVLNCERILIGDIDIKPASSFDKLLRWLGRPIRNKAYYLQAIKDFQQKYNHIALLVYETYGGLRFIVTSEFIEPESDQAKLLFNALNVDPLYKILCQRQKCFRARLTPKPWRLGVARPELRFPYESERQEQAFNEWLDNYQRACKGYGVLKLVARLGNTSVPAAIDRVLAVHDRAIALAGEELA